MESMIIMAALFLGLLIDLIWWRKRSERQRREWSMIRQRGRAIDRLRKECAKYV